MATLHQKRPRSPAQQAATAKMLARLKEGRENHSFRIGRAPSLATLQKRADKDAREKFLAFASTNVLPVGDALVKKAMDGDVMAIKEFFDRVWGKAPQSVSVDVEHHFTLRGTNQDATQLPAPIHESVRIIEHGKETPRE